MIIRIIATALIQCTMRTQAGWITLEVVGTACSSLAAMLDMAHLWRRFDTLLYAGNRGFVTAMPAIKAMPAGMAVTKKRAGLPRLAVSASCWGLDQDTCGITTRASARCRPHGSRRSTG